MLSVYSGIQVGACTILECMECMAIAVYTDMNDGLCPRQRERSMGGKLTNVRFH